MDPQKDGYGRWKLFPKPSFMTLSEPSGIYGGDRRGSLRLEDSGKDQADPAHC